MILPYNYHYAKGSHEGFIRPNSLDGKSIKTHLKVFQKEKRFASSSSNFLVNNHR